MSIQQDVWNFLRSKSLPEKSVAAVMGNIEAESEFDESLIEKGSGVGFGLCQWSYERRTQLEAYGTDLTHQLNFLWAELTGNIGDTGASPQWTSENGYISLPAFLSGDGSIADLTAAMCFCWERPNASVAHLDRRQEKAQEYFNQFTGTAGAPSVLSASSQETMTIESTNYEVVAGSQQQGDILYGRRYRITVSDSSGNGIDVSKLRCTFSILKTIQMEPNFSQITIYNLNAQTENSITMNGARVTVEAGYEGRQFGVIFDGDILQVIRDKEDSTTYRLTIIALDSDRALNFEISNYSILRGQTTRTIVEHIINQAKYPISIGSISSSLDNSLSLTRGKVFFGKASDYLRQIAESNGCKFYMDNGQVHIIKMDELPDGEIYDLSPTSGLIGTPEQSDYGISGQFLLNPAIKINSLIHVDNSLVRAKQVSLGGNNNTVPSLTGANSTVRQQIISKAEEIVKKCQSGKARYHLGGYRTGGYGTVYTDSSGIEWYDCSIFAEICYMAAGIKMAAPSGDQYELCKSGGFVYENLDKIKSEGKAGDLLFRGEGGSQHVAIYDGNGGQFAAHDAYGDSRDIRHDDNLNSVDRWGRCKELANADNGTPPSAASNTTGNSNSSVQTPVYRSLDKDGIYRVIKITYEGDTRGDSWYCKFESIDQLGGTIPIVAT